jgi:type IV secretion system protein VirB9
MIVHHSLRPVLVALLLGCTAEKILAQSHVVESTSETIQSSRLSRLQRSLEKPIQVNEARLGYRDDPAAVKHLPMKKAPSMITDGFVQLKYHYSQSPIVHTAPFQETVIHLETGEHYTNISSGDPNRWSYAVAISGMGKTEQQHVLVKPSLPEISTNLVIATDKRLYHLQLVSHANQPVTRSLSFGYPHDLPEPTLQDASQDKLECHGKALNAHHPAMHFDYQIMRTNLFGSAPSWWPKQVFDDGEKTYIVCPDEVKQQELPVLMILDHGQKELVNYRFKDNHFVVDKIFDKALLMGGVGQSEVSVLIRRVK